MIQKSQDATKLDPFWFPSSRPIQLTSPLSSSAATCISDAHALALAWQKAFLSSDVCLILKTAFSFRVSWLSWNLFKMEFAQDIRALYSVLHDFWTSEWSSSGCWKETANWGYLRNGRVASSPRWEVKNENESCVVYPHLSFQNMQWCFSERSELLCCDLLIVLTAKHEWNNQSKSLFNSSIA